MEEALLGVAAIGAVVVGLLFVSAVLNAFRHAPPPSPRDQWRAFSDLPLIPKALFVLSVTAGIAAAFVFDVR